MDAIAPQLDELLTALDAETARLGSAFDAISFAWSDGLPGGTDYSLVEDDERINDQRLVYVVERDGQRVVIAHRPGSGWGAA